MSDVVYLIRDLPFVSKVRETAEQLGVAVQGVRTADALMAAAPGARLVILDLRQQEAMRALELLAADPVTRVITTVGFIDHERTDVMDDARAMGCGRVVAKGQLVGELPKLIAAARPPAS